MGNIRAKVRSPAQACCATLDGGPATETPLGYVYGMAVGPDGSVYFVDSTQRARRVSPDGMITTIAGTVGVEGSSGDGGPAIDALLRFPSAVAVAADGPLYIADNERVRRVSTDGIITTVAGGGSTIADGVPATSADLLGLAAVAVGPDGSVYLAAHSRVRRVAPDGLITTVAGTGDFGHSGDGSPATQAPLTYPAAIAFSRDGAMYIADRNENCVRRVGSDGIITTVAGTCTAGRSGDGGPATAAQLSGPSGLAVAGDGSLLIADTQNWQIRRVAMSLPWLPEGQIQIPSEDARELYVFDAQGRHLRTVDALTGGVRWQFGYDGNGFLSTLTDGASNVTTIERDVEGNPTAIVSPYGQRTTLSLDANGYLAGITDPANAATAFSYTPDGLMTSMTNPRGFTWTFAYDALGRLTQDADPAGGSKSLTRTDVNTQDYTVSTSTVLGRTRSYRVEQLTAGGQQWTNTGTDGTQTTRIYGTDGTTTVTTPDGTTTATTQRPDPRFGMAAPLTSQSIELPSGLTSTAAAQRVVTLTDPSDPLSLTALTDTQTVNGRVFNSSYNASTRTFTDTTPVGRQTLRMLDALGRTVLSQRLGLAPSNMTYDARGRLATITQGSGQTARTTTFGYDTLGNLASIVDAAGRQVTFSYDAAGRMVSQTLPDGRVIAYSYDENGNLTLLTPPGRPDHTFDYTAVDLQSQYAPPQPQPPVSSPQTLYQYNLDRQLTEITRPDGLLIDFLYDLAGRLSGRVLPGNQTVSYGYDPTTGNLVTITAPDGGTLSFTYDGNLLLSETWAGTVGGSVSRAYDTNFRVSSQSVNSANTVSFSYDADSLLAASGALAVTRDPQTGLATGATLGQVADAITYNDFGEPLTYTANASGTPVYMAQYRHDVLGRISEKSETVDGTTHTYDYSYDVAGRLTDVVTDGLPTAHYDYDLNSNRIGGFSQLCSSIGNASIDAQDRVLTLDCGLSTVSYTYTPNGELAAKTDANGTTTYAYDVLGNLRTVVVPGGDQIEYITDGQNRRIGKKVNGSLVQGFLYDGQLRIVAELDGSNNVVSRFVYGEKPNAPEYMMRGGVAYRLISDHLGSPRLVVNATTGVAVQRMEYDEFGNVLADSNPGFQPFGFAGGLYDGSTKLIRFGARDYDPAIGRWTSKDPIRFAGRDTNLYGYILADPVNRIDPFGLYGTNDCSYYAQRCLESGGGYYCETAPAWCNWFPKPPDPDPSRDNDYEGPYRCIRQCLQDCDRFLNRNQSSCPADDSSTNDFWSEKPLACHAACYTACLVPSGNSLAP